MKKQSFWGTRYIWWKKPVKQCVVHFEPNVIINRVLKSVWCRNQMSWFRVTHLTIHGLIRLRIYVAMYPLLHDVESDLWWCIFSRDTPGRDLCFTEIVHDALKDDTNEEMTKSSDTPYFNLNQQNLKAV